MPKRLNLRTVLPLIILVLAGTLALVVTRNFRGGGPEEILETLPSNVDLSLKDFRYTESSGDQRQWTLEADSATHSVGEGATRIEEVLLTFHDVKNMDSVTVTARTGLWRSDRREVQMDGDVVVKSPRGYFLYTDRLHYREADRMIWTDEPVRMVSPTMEVVGRGLRFDVAANRLVLLSSVEAQIEGRRFGKEG